MQKIRVSAKNSKKLLPKLEEDKSYFTPQKMEEQKAWCNTPLHWREWKNVTSAFFKLVFSFEIDKQSLGGLGLLIKAWN